MNISKASPIAHPSAWRAVDLIKPPEEWKVQWPPTVLTELQEEAARIDRSSVNTITRHIVDRSRLGNAIHFLSSIEREVMLGRGFVLLLGLPSSLEDDMLRACYWTVMNLLGAPVSQNSYGDLMCEVKDTGQKLGAPRVRGYQTNAELRFHTDRASMVGLLCMERASSGGTSRICSAMTVFNRLLEERPDLIDVLSVGLNYMSVEEGGEISVRRMPVFHVQDGVISCRYSRNTLDTAILSGVPYSDVERESLEVLDRLAEEPQSCLEMMLDRGDIQLVNNFTTLHARTEYEDGPDKRRKRCMIRAWITTNIRRPVGKHFDDYFGVPITLKRGVS